MQNVLVILQHGIRQALSDGTRVTCPAVVVYHSTQLQAFYGDLPMDCVTFGY